MTETPDQPEISPGFNDSYTAPIVYFDTVAAFGVLAGAVQVELISRILVPLAGAGAKHQFLTTGRIRCSPHAAMTLRDSLSKALDMVAKEREGQQAQAAKMN
jgi:hypothetical protein